MSSLFITEARAFDIRPQPFDDLLDIVVQGRDQDLDHLKAAPLAVFDARHFQLYSETFDPNVPNRIG